MSRTPNSEQKLAIEHFGGVLLSAGAGSGKTFVLVEHLVYLVEKFLERTEYNDEEDLLIKLKSYLSKIVLMTFTNEAAGELTLRIYRRIEQIEHKSEGTTWSVVKEALSSMVISTIHGFCFKLLGGGYFKDFNPNATILSEVESQNRISKLYDKWFEKQREEFSNEDFLSTLLLNEDTVKKSLKSIFDNPDLRIAWQNWKPEEVKEFDLSKFIKDLSHLLPLSFDSLKNTLDVSEYESESSAKWFPYLKDFEEVCSRYSFSDIEFYHEVNRIIETYPRVMPPRKKGLEVPKERMTYLTQVKNFVKDYGIHILKFSADKDGVVFDWARLFKDSFDYIETHYNSIPGITFSDLEYFVLSGLDDEETIERIYNDYNYLIVDEFQDTSWVQFEIIRRVIKSDFNRLFCVGDEKQAIYGFRGGELGVFKECSEKIPKNLSLLNNYRSEDKIIEANNKIFDHLFRLGPGFEGVDKHAVEVKYQEFPSDVKEAGLGEVCESLVKINIDEELKKQPKISNVQLNEVEAISLFESIKRLLPLKEDIAVLYKNLKPSSLLIEKLIDEDIPFTAQVKIPLSEDPIISTFFEVLQALLEKEEHLETLVINVRGTLYLMGMNGDIDIEGLFKKFKTDENTVGLYYAFLNFVTSLGIANSNSDNNLEQVRILCKVFNDNKELVWNSIRKSSGDKYSIDFKFGENSSIRIMTAHGSKGLEFDHVLLGGIHTNGGRVPDTLLLGKFPGSFKWKDLDGSKKSYQTPEYIIEALVNKEKDFAESKRLFYVAATRAVKTLNWSNVYTRIDTLSYLKNSWIDGFRHWKDSKFSVELSTINEEHELIEEEEKLVALESKAPIFHLDNLGVEDSGRSRGLGLISELSVTKLSTLTQCSRKFYLQNICKLDDSFLDIFDENYQVTYHDDGEEQIFSSAKRGSEIHEDISVSILDKSFSSKLINKRSKESSQWALDLAKKRSTNSVLISEEMMKFPIFGQMISGIPDLVVKDESGDFEIWDFKTGALKDEKLTPYWFQLACYGLAVIEQGKDLSKKVSLNLLFVDEKQELKKEYNHEELTMLMKEQWWKLESLNQVNTDHCEQCHYNSLCSYKTTHVAD